MQTQVRRAIALAIVLLTVFAVETHFAYAGESVLASQSTPVTSGSWKVTASSTVITFPASVVTSTPQYLSVTNSGTLALIGTTYNIAITGISVGTVAINACSGTWNETAHTCSGSTSTIVSGSTTTSPITTNTTAGGQYPAAASSTLRLQVSNSGAVVTPVVVTLTLSVTRSQVRAATTANS